MPIFDKIVVNTVVGLLSYTLCFGMPNPKLTYLKLPDTVFCPFILFQLTFYILLTVASMILYFELLF